MVKFSLNHIIKSCFGLNYANLEILDIALPLGFNTFEDLGYVDSIEDTIEMLSKKPFLKRSNNRQLLGNTFLFEYKFFNLKNISIFYLKLPKKIQNIYVRAHEETHALDILGGLELLEKELRDEQKVKINFKKINDEEVRADIGAIYALYKNNYSDSDFHLLYKDINYLKAKTLFDECKI